MLDNDTISAHFIGSVEKVAVMAVVLSQNGSKTRDHQLSQKKHGDSAGEFMTASAMVCSALATAATPGDAGPRGLPNGPVCVPSSARCVPLTALQVR